MEITNEPLLWDSEDIDLFRAFLLTRTGQRLLPKLAESAPSIVYRGNKTGYIIAAGELRGFQVAIKELMALAVHPPFVPRRADEYPALEDDSAHSDGQKINE